MEDKLRLNKQQEEAISYRLGPLLIVAGAGAGKTKTIIARIAGLIQNGVAPAEVLAVTFTNKAAGEMRERLNKSLKPTGWLATLDYFDDTWPFVSTFHALGVYILRRHAGQIGFNRHFNILDREDSLTRIKEAMRPAGLDPKQFEPRKILGAISRLKGEGIDCSDYETTGEYFANIIGNVWPRYEKILAKDQALDFDDLLLKTVRLFRRQPEILALYQDRWRYIHIDEYQDTNGIQYELSKLLAGRHKNICVVGDMDQSIYSWRGADFTNILNFEKDYPEAKVVLLEENYRSTKNILEAANDIIKKNQNRKEKKLFTKNEAGRPITVYGAADETAEADYVADRARQLIGRGRAAETVAVLYRANFQSRALEEAFLRVGIPYQVLGTKFFDRKEIKDVLAYLKTALNPDDLASLKRIANVPRRGIGKVTLAKIAAGEEGRLPIKMREKLAELRKFLALLRAEILSGQKSASAIIKLVIEQTGLAFELRRGGDDDLERLENIRELATLTGKYDLLPTETGILRLLDEAALMSEQDTLQEEVRAVRLMTVHAAKGLEFNVVFVTGLEDGLFPHQSVWGQDDDRDEEEERRLFYVAITRARRKLFLTYAQSRMIYGSRQINRPSEFLLDLDDRYLSMEADANFTSGEIIN